MRLDVPNEIVQGMAHLNEAVRELSHLILRGNRLRHFAQIPLIEQFTCTENLLDIGSKRICNEEDNCRHDKNHYERHTGKNCKEILCL